MSIRKFNIQNLKNDSNIMIIGSKCSGKSTLIKDIIYNNKKTSVGSVISCGENVEHFYDKFINNTLIHTEYDPLILERLFECQIKAYHEKLVNYNKILVMDECFVASDKIQNDKKIQELFFNGRNYRILSILTTQFPMRLSPSLRVNIDCIFIFKNHDIKHKREIYQYYASIFKSFEEFETILDSLDNYNCLVIDYSSKLEDQIFYYKAELYEAELIDIVDNYVIV